MDGRALTSAELAAVAGVGAPTASTHLSKLVDGGVLDVERTGRRCYYRLADAEVAQAIEALEALAARTAPDGELTGPRDPAPRRLRTCYDHLAGREAVALLERQIALGWLVAAADDFELTPTGREAYGALGVDLNAQGRRRFARRCLDWSERRAHLGGALGAALLTRLEGLDWVARGPHARAAAFTAAGRAGLADWAGLDLTQ